MNGRVYNKDDKTIREAIEEQNDDWYKYVSYTDAYQQLINFYSVFQTKTHH